MARSLCQHALMNRLSLATPLATAIATNRTRTYFKITRSHFVFPFIQNNVAEAKWRIDWLLILFSEINVANVITIEDRELDQDDAT